MASPVGRRLRDGPPVVVIMVGPPGVGKGTQGGLLAEATGSRHIATGDLLRAALRDGIDLGREAQEFMSRGELGPDQLMVGLVRDVVEKMDRDVGAVLDGFPRTVGQAEALEGVLFELDRKADLVVVLEADDDVIVKRMAGRRSCGQCGAVYNVHCSRPKQDGICDQCGGVLTLRPDDDPVTVRNRIEVFRRETTPLIGYFDESPTPVHRVQADQSVADVQCALWEVVGG